MTEEEATAALGRYKLQAALAIIIGWCLVAWAGYALLGHPGGALALGGPMMYWGWWTAKKVIETEVLLGKK